MSQASSVSEDGGEAKWKYIRPELGRTGRSLSENNFAKERRDWLSILLREVLQNALDARTSPDVPVEVVMKKVDLSDEGRVYLSSFITDEHIQRFKQSVPHLQGAEIEPVRTCLVFEDFGTSGLTGVLDDPEKDGKGENWNAFWFREGEGGKENSSGNGGAGQGKITYFSTSQIRTMFGYTVRSTEMSEALFGASSFLRDYFHQDHKWKRDAYFGLCESDRLVLPIDERDFIDTFCSHLGLSRKKEQCGLSLVIPSPKEASEAAAVEIVLAEFFVPILRGDLVVRIGGTTIESASVAALANSKLADDRARELHTCTTKGYREFLLQAVDRSQKSEVVLAKPVATASEISEASFDPVGLAAMREALYDEKPVSVRFSLTVKPKSGSPVACQFDVHLETPDDLAMLEQAVIRRDLLIGEEPIGGGKLKQRARALTLVTNPELSKLLLSAEEATHLRWNTKLPRLAEYYRSGPDVVSIVRNAAAKLLDILNEGAQKRDFKALAKYFSAPGDASSAKTKGKKDKKGKEQPEKGDIPPPKPKLLALQALADGCRVLPSKVGALEGAKLPIAVKVEFAYEGLDKDAFSEYDPLDFDLADKDFQVLATGCEGIEKKLNELTFVVGKTDFELAVHGFDERLRLRMRLNYEEAADATAINAE